MLVLCPLTVSCDRPEPEHLGTPELPSINTLGEAMSNLVLRLPDGGWVAVDPIERELTRYTPDEARERVLGRLGAGPGEIGTLADLVRTGAADGSFLSLDVTNRRVTTHGAMGEVRGSFPVTLTPRRLWPVTDSLVAVYGMDGVTPIVVLYNRVSGTIIGDRWAPTSWRPPFSPATPVVQTQVAHAYSVNGDAVAAVGFSGELRCTNVLVRWPPQWAPTPNDWCRWQAPEQPIMSEAQIGVWVEQYTSLMQATQKLLPGTSSDLFAPVIERSRREASALPAPKILQVTFGADDVLWVATPWLVNASRLRSAVYRVHRDGSARHVLVVDGWVNRLSESDTVLLVMATQPSGVSLGWAVTATSDSLRHLVSPTPAPDDPTQ